MHRVNQDPLTPNVAFALALLYLALNFFTSTFSIYFGAILTAILVWKADINYLPSLIIPFLGKHNFVMSARGSFSQLLLSFEARIIMIAGFPVSISYICLLAIFLRITWEWCVNPRFHLQQKNLGMLWLWYIALIPAVIMAFWGRINGNPSWTYTIRIVLTAGAYFYGSIVAHRTKSLSSIALKQFIFTLFILLFLASRGRFHNHLLWLLSGFSVPFAWIVWKSSLPYSKLTALGILFSSFSYSIGVWRAGSSAGAGLTGGQATFTLNAIWLISFALTVLLIARQNNRIFKAHVFSGIWLPFLILGFTFTVASLSPKMIGRQAGIAERDMSIPERIQFKIFDDRSVIWTGVLENITSEHLFLRPANEPLIMYRERHGYVHLNVGSHNTPLEVIRNLRWFSGPIILMIFLGAGVSAVKSSKAGNPMIIRIFSIGIVVSTLIGGITGHYLVGADVSFFHFYIAGFVFGMRKRYEVDPHLREVLLGLEDRLFTIGRIPFGSKIHHYA